MNPIIVVTLLMVLLNTIPGFVRGDYAWYLTQWFDGIIITLWVYIGYSLIDVKEYDRKFFMVAVLLVSFINNLVYPLWVFYPNAEYYAYPVQVGALLSLLYKVKQRNYLYESDDLNSSTVALCFWRPKKTGSFFHSLAGAPVASVGIYADGIFWSYRWGEPRFGRRQMCVEEVYEKFIVIDTGVQYTSRIKRKLNDLLGTPARRLKTLGFRANCILTIKPVLAELGGFYTPRFLEFLPALYAARIFKNVR